MAGLSGGFFDGLPSERRHVDSPALGFEIGQVAGFQTVRLARYRYVDVRPSLDFPTAPHRSQIHEVLALYRLYLMPDHWAGPLVQVGPSLAIARNSPVPGDPGDDRYDFFGGLCLGTGAYAHLNTQVSFRFDVLFDRLTTGRVFSHDAEWSHEFAFGLNVVYGIPKHVGPSR